MTFFPSLTRDAFIGLVDRNPSLAFERYMVRICIRLVHIYLVQYKCVCAYTYSTQLLHILYIRVCL